MKMSNRTAAMLGLVANLLFWPSLLVFAALNPRYSHLTKSVSELGAWGAANMWAFNVLGFIGPGLLLAVFGWMLARRALAHGWVTASLLALAGVFVAVAGVFPADMSDFSSPTTIGHLVGSNGSVVAWVAALIALAIAARRSWPTLAIVSALGIVFMLAAFSLYFTSPVPRAIVQRICFGVFYCWYLVAAALLLKRQTVPEAA